MLDHLSPSSNSNQNFTQIAVSKLLFFAISTAILSINKHVQKITFSEFVFYLNKAIQIAKSWCLVIYWFNFIFYTLMLSLKIISVVSFVLIVYELIHINCCIHSAIWWFCYDGSTTTIAVLLMNSLCLLKKNWNIKSWFCVDNI